MMFLLKPARKLKKPWEFSKRDNPKKEKGPKRIPQTYVLCELIVTQKFTDEAIAKTASKKLNKEITVRDVRIIRSSINNGLRVGTGFPVPKKPLVQIVK